MKKDSKLSPTKVPFLQSFFRSQASSIAATATDWSVYFILFKLAGVYYGLSSGIGAVFGAVVSFYLGRHWAFKRKDGKLSSQALRYGITSAISVFLNTSGMIWVTEQMNISPDYSKVIVALLVGVIFNFFMFRYFVYR